MGGDFSVGLEVYDILTSVGARIRYTCVAFSF